MKIEFGEYSIQFLIFWITEKIRNSFFGNLIHGPKVTFNIHFKIGTEKAIFVYFDFDSKLKIEKKSSFFVFKFPFYFKILNYQYLALIKLTLNELIL